MDQRCGLKWQNTCFASLKPQVETPVSPKGKKNVKTFVGKRNQVGHWWLQPVILATQEAEIRIRRIAVGSQPWGK
jgi:hypothetical protein